MLVLRGIPSPSPRGQEKVLRSMMRNPEYKYMFEYMVEHYTFNQPDNPITRFYKWDISEKQYSRLDGPVNPEKYEFSPQEAADMITEFAKDCAADLVGFTEVKPNFVFKGNEISGKYAVVIAKEMDYDRIMTAPEAPSGVEVLRIYWRMGNIALKIASFIRRLGYEAVAHHPRNFLKREPEILHTAAALEAGLGEVGRHGLLITKEFGPRVRVATITTELELPQAQRADHGIDKYCRTCRLCRDACEGDAIPDEKTDRSGILKYTIDPFKCLPYFAKYDGCNLCVSKCAFNKGPDELKKFFEKLG